MMRNEEELIRLDGGKREKVEALRDWAYRFGDDRSDNVTLMDEAVGYAVDVWGDREEKSTVWVYKMDETRRIEEEVGADPEHGVTEEGMELLDDAYEAFADRYANRQVELAEDTSEGYRSTLSRLRRVGEYSRLDLTAVAEAEHTEDPRRLRSEEEKTVEELFGGT